MNQIILYGWVAGLSIIELTKLIRTSCGMNLADAKDCIDRLLEGHDVELIFGQVSQTEEFVAAATALGAQVRIGAMR